MDQITAIKRQLLDSGVSLEPPRRDPSPSTSMCSTVNKRSVATAVEMLHNATA